jgi:hypothetical protein
VVVLVVVVVLVLVVVVLLSCVGCSFQAEYITSTEHPSTQPHSPRPNNLSLFAPQHRSRAGGPSSKRTKLAAATGCPLPADQCLVVLSTAFTHVLRMSFLFVCSLSAFYLFVVYFSCPSELQF